MPFSIIIISLRTALKFISVVLTVLYGIADLMSLQALVITTQSRGTLRTLQFKESAITFNFVKFVLYVGGGDVDD